ncbi:Phage holin family 2 [Burkholderia sp. GAS332]|nr:Phage holin family 2 [Burkholderia sp. GAS332]
MQLNEHERTLALLAVIGAVIGLGQLFVGGDRITVRILLGRMIIGAGLSASAGAVLMVFKDLSPTALVGVASAIGILGQNVLEVVVQKFIGKLPGGKDVRDAE